MGFDLLNGIVPIGDRDDFVAFLFQKHDLRLEQTDFVVCPQNGDVVVHSVCDFYSCNTPA